MKFLNHVLRRFPWCLFVLFMVGCGPTNLCGKSIVKTLPSPDGRVDILIEESDCGATTSTATRIYVVPKGLNVDSQTPVMILDGIGSLDIRWTENKEVLVELDGGRIFSYSNFWQSKEADNFGYLVRFHLVEKKGLDKKLR